MKSFNLVLIVATAWLLGLAGSAFGDLQSLRGAAISPTLDAPEVMQFKKDKENIPRTSRSSRRWCRTSMRSTPSI